MDWYQGTADAVRKNLRYVQQPGIDRVLILSGDQLYRMDFRAMLASHEASGADVTIAAVPSQQGRLRAGHHAAGRHRPVVGFLENPRPTRVGPRPHQPRLDRRARVASHGRELPGQHGDLPLQPPRPAGRLQKTDYQDFGKEVFPASIRSAASCPTCSTATGKTSARSRPSSRRTSG